MLKTITADEVLRTNDKGVIIIRGRELSKEQQERLKSEADFLSKSITMKLLMDDMEYLAHQVMFYKSNNYDDMLFGKSMLYVIDILKKKITNLAK